MHLVQSQALQTGQCITKMQVLDKFFPIPFGKYIVFQPYSKDSKNYDYWQTVIDILSPILLKQDIRIIQVGAKDERPIKGCVHTQGQTTINQVAYIVRHSLLVLSADSFCAHLAGHYDKPVVTCYSNNYVENVKPYFGSPEKQILLEPERNGNKPSFSFSENPKTINTIRPETIAESVCRLLSLPFDYPYQTVHWGGIYTHPLVVEMVPDKVLNVGALGLESIILRMDYEFNEPNLAQQLMLSPVSIVTNKPINLNLLNQFRKHVRQLVYVVEEDNDSNFALMAVRLNLPLSLITSLPTEKFDKYKLDYLEIGFVHQRLTPSAETFGPFQTTDNLFYKSNKITLAREKIYPCKLAWKQDKPIPTLECPFLPVERTTEFLEELDYLYLVKNKS